MTGSIIFLKLVNKAQPQYTKMEKLFKSISNYINLSNQLKEELRARLHKQSFKKKESVLDSSKVCQNSYFIEKGIMRLYYLKDGKEISEFFCSENEWMNSPRSFMQQKTDFYNIDVVENSVAWRINISDLVYLFDNFPEMERYARMDMGSTFGYVLERVASLRFSTAREKYEHFLKTYPHIYHRIPLGMVASHIGITQETLSRLRKDDLF